MNRTLDTRWKNSGGRQPPRVRRDELRRIATFAIRDIEGSIVGMVSTGRELKIEFDSGYRAVLAHIGTKTSRKCVLIVEETRHGMQIVAFKTEGKFKRSVRNRFTSRERRRAYSNRPQRLRY